MNGTLDTIVTVGHKLVDLGETADEVAASLRAKGIVGDRKDGLNCPLAVFIKGLGVDSTRVEVFTNHCYVEQRRLDLSNACGEFVREFDVGMYPELIRPLSPDLSIDDLLKKFPNADATTAQPTPEGPV